MKYKYSFGGIFSDVGFSFKIDHKLIKKIWYSIEEKVPLSQTFEKAYPGFTITFLYSTKKDIGYYVSDATVVKRDKEIEYVIYMPFEELKVENDQIKNKSFLKYLKYGILEIFEIHDFDTEKINEVFKTVSDG